MTTSDHIHTAFPDDSAFLDADPLHLSEHGDLDDFDFMLEDAAGLDEEHVFANSRGSSDLDMLLANGMVGITGNSRDGSRRSSFDILAGLASSKGSMGMDFQLETELNSSMTRLAFDALEENGDDKATTVMRSSSGSSGYRPSRRRASTTRRSAQRDPSLHGSAPARSFQMGAMNFDPAPQSSAPQAQQPTRSFKTHQRQTSHGDLSMCSYTTAQSSVAQSINRRIRTRKQHILVFFLGGSIPIQQGLATPCRIHETYGRITFTGDETAQGYAEPCARKCIGSGEGTTSEAE